MNVTSVQSISKCFFKWKQSYLEVFHQRFLKFTIPFFFNSENLSSSIDQCTGSFIQTFKTKMAGNNGTAPPLERDYMKENRIYLFFYSLF